MNYADFLSRKEPTVPMRGITSVPTLNPRLKPHQAHCAEFALRAGSAGIYLDTGLGKSLVQLEFGRVVAETTGRPFLVLTPLAVAWQMAREAELFGIEARVIREQADVGPSVNICNYDRLDRLDVDAFGGVALDEASILKSFTGKTTRALIRSFAAHRFRMAATATPAPNDHMELGQHAEFLGIMPSNEMLMRWFIADQTQMGRYRLKGHAVTSFWDWFASFARLAQSPADLGFDATGYDLPPLDVRRHKVEAPVEKIDGGLFGAVDVSATGIHDVKRQTAAARAGRVAEMVHAEPGEPWLIWCDTDYEADALAARIPDAVEVRGSHAPELKEERLAAFVSGQSRIIISKPSICGYGLNFQHCARMAFVGRSFSYESWYQAVRRCWRFGQSRAVTVHVMVADGEDAIGRVIDRKAEDHVRMKAAMVAAMRRAASASSMLTGPYDPRHAGRLPAWMEVA
jgi:hypothetical protein